MQIILQLFFFGIWAAYNIKYKKFSHGNGLCQLRNNFFFKLLFLLKIFVKKFGSFKKKS